jgi:hypothetical protein
MGINNAQAFIFFFARQIKKVAVIQYLQAFPDLSTLLKQ